MCLLKLESNQRPGAQEAPPLLNIVTSQRRTFSPNSSPSPATTEPLDPANTNLWQTTNRSVVTFSSLVLIINVSPALVKHLVLVLSSVPVEESRNHFGYFFTLPLSLSLSYLLWVLSSGYLFSAKTYYVLFPICYVWCFFGVIMMRLHEEGGRDSRHGWIQIFSVKPCMGCVCVCACVFWEYRQLVLSHSCHAVQLSI